MARDTPAPLYCTIVSAQDCGGALSSLFATEVDHSLLQLPVSEYLGQIVWLCFQQSRHTDRQYPYNMQEGFAQLCRHVKDTFQAQKGWSRTSGVTIT